MVGRKLFRLVLAASLRRSFARVVAGPKSATSRLWRRNVVRWEFERCARVLQVTRRAVSWGCGRVRGAWSDDEGSRSAAHWRPQRTELKWKHAASIGTRWSPGDRGLDLQLEPDMLGMTFRSLGRVPSTHPLAADSRSILGTPHVLGLCITERKSVFLAEGPRDKLKDLETYSASGLSFLSILGTCTESVLIDATASREIDVFQTLMTASGTLIPYVIPELTSELGPWSLGHVFTADQEGVYVRIGHVRAVG